MDQKRKVVYYTNREATCGEIDFENESQFETAEGHLLGFGYRVQHLNDQSFQITEAIIEDPQNGEIICICYNQLKNFCD